ncbi:MAG: Alpha-galactosidase [Akkermansiaceae bacterium]|nr:Alpha-galactosidase [Akkermansiaceae bacterium]
MTDPRDALRTCAFFFACLLPAAAGTVIDVTTFGAVADSGQDATEAFQKAIAAAASAEKPVILNLPAGRYDLHSTHATRRACYYSNATEKDSDAVRTIALDLSHLDQVTIRGNGSALLMHGAMTMVVAEESTRLTLTGLSFDFARPSVSEITAVEKGDGFWIGQVHPSSTFTITGGNRIQWTGEDWRSYADQCQPYDPERKITWRGNDPTSSASAIEDLGQGRLKFTVPPATLENARPGWTYQFRNSVRDEAGMWFSRCKDIAMSDVKIHAMRGFGVLSQFTENVSFDRITVAPQEGSGRTAVSAADILHFVACRGKIHIADSTLTCAHDDALNVHGVHLKVVAAPAPDRIVVRFGHSQTWGFQAYVPGDVIEFVKPGTLLPFGTATVTAVEFQPGQHDQTLTLDRAIPAGVAMNTDVIENLTWTPSLEVLRCNVGQVPTRGFLITTRQPAVVRDCRFFRTRMPCILVEDDAAGWFESGPVKDLTLTGNTFFECGMTPIQFSPQNTAHAGAVHSHIRILDNDFTLAGDKAMDFKSTSDILVKGNRFRMENGKTPAVESLAETKDVEGLKWQDNEVIPGATK